MMDDALDQLDEAPKKNDDVKEHETNDTVIQNIVVEEYEAKHHGAMNSSVDIDDSMMDDAFEKFNEAQLTPISPNYAETPMSVVSDGMMNDVLNDMADIDS